MALRNPELFGSPQWVGLVNPLTLIIAKQQFLTCLGKAPCSDIVIAQSRSNRQL